MVDILFGRVPSAYKENVLSRYMIPVSCGVMSLVAVCGANAVTRRPAMSGIQKHIAAVTVAGIVGEYLYHWKKGYYAERDAVMRHYIELHPEDFVEIPKKKYKDVLEDWIPVR